jgi:hypothetical protein
MGFFITQDTMGTINIDWTLADIKVLDLARACGYLVAKHCTTAISTPNSSFTTLDGAFQSPNLPHVLVWPEKLINHKKLVGKLLHKIWRSITTMNEL